jgi:ribonuclease Z
LRDLAVLGTASQVPTRHRNHNGYFLRWDGEGILFDPGEGTQRQMMFAGVTAASITRICITHLHGDHCLGLPGVLQRVALDRVTHPVDVYFPATGLPFVERLQTSSVFDDTTLDVRLHPVAEDGVVDTCEQFSIHARFLDHGPDTVGWRVEEPDGRRMDRAALETMGIGGPAVSRLLLDGALTLPDGRLVRLEDVSEHRPGQVFAFVMDTRWCSGAVELARNADLLVAEATFSSADLELAEAYGHLTARQAGELAAGAGARRLVITHFSQRYRDVEVLRAEAAEVFPDVVVANDLDRIDVPRRR